MDDIEDFQGANGSCPAASPLEGEVLAKSSRQRVRQRQAAVGYDIPGSQIIYLKTYGCAHNASDGEYMAGQLVAHGYGITEDFDTADAYILNSCTVKNPSEAHLFTLIKKAKATGKPVIVAGCVPQGDQKNSAWDDLSVIGVQQIDRVVEVVQEALRGNKVHLFSRNKRNRPGLDLPKVRRNRWIEIIPINVGCLNQCTYCKTKHARGNLSSWPISEICDRVKQAINEGVVEIRMTSEDTGAYGRDIGTNIAELLQEVVRHIPDGVMLRVGMTNPPYILEHLDAICDILNRPNVYSYLHLPVQAGSNRVLDLMKREYTVQEFRYIVEKLRANVSGINIATDIICGFPGETDEDFEATAKLCEELRFPFLNISQFYSRHGTPAAAMKPLDSRVIKQRSRRITQIFDSYNDCFKHLVGTTQRVYITELANDGYHLVGHTKCYTQVLVSPEEAELGTSVFIEVTEASKWFVRGKVVGYSEKVPRSLADADDIEFAEGTCCGGSSAQCCCHGPSEANQVDIVDVILKGAVAVLGVSTGVLLWLRSRRH